MFQVHAHEMNRSGYRYAVFGLLLLSAAALLITIWVMNDFLKEQKIVEELIRKLPADATETAEQLAGELRWQFRLTMLVVLNVIVTGIAVVLLWRGYQTSQESLRDVKALATDILSNMDQAVITTDLQGKLTSINKRGLEFLTTTMSCVGKPLTQFSDRIPLQQYLQDWLIEKSTSYVRDYTIVIEGISRTFRAFCQILVNIDNQHSGFVLQLRDVTSRLLIEERMRRMERYMGLGSLAAGLHHEIKNPLAALSLHVQLLEEELQQHDQSQELQQMFQIIKTEVGRIGSVLEGFRDFASIGRLNLFTVDISGMIRQQVELIRPSASQRKIELHVETTKCDSLEIPVDRVRLEQVLHNLFINSMEAMPQGGKLSIEAAYQTNELTMTISDTGHGIPADLHDKIFDPYFTTKNDGTGLGLAICDKIIRQHGGSIIFQSTAQGTIFTISLPCGDDQITGTTPDGQ